MLEQAHRDVHDSGQCMHAALRVLRGAEGWSAAGGLRRTAPGGRSLRALGLKFAVITSVNRDDRKDGGAELFALTIRAIRDRIPGCGVEVLVPDFQGSHAAMDIVLEASPDVLNHNTETVPRLYRQVRLGARYERSLDMLSYAKTVRPEIPTKSGLMLGLGETLDEVRQVMRDLRAIAWTSDARPVFAAVAEASADHPVRDATRVRRFEALRVRVGIPARRIGTAGAQFLSRGGRGQFVSHIQEPAPGLRLIRLPLPFELEHVNVGLVSLDEGYMLIDTGMAGNRSFEALQPALDECGVTWPEIRAVLATHIHPDHVGAVPRVLDVTGANCTCTARSWRT
jgi:hypothetical protein